MHISVLLSTLKRPSLLEQTLKGFSSLETSAIDWELLVVDNADDEETREIVRQYSGRMPVKYLLEPRRGKNHALNHALEHAQGELFVFTDDDVLPERDWLTEMWEGSKRWPDNHVFGGRVLPRFPGNRSLPFEHEFFLGAFVIADWDLPEGCYEAHMVWGPNMAVRSEIFRNGWRFNPNVGPDGTDEYASGSETNLTMRLEREGYRPVYLPRSLVYHQIREEQLENRWLFRRAFRLGQQAGHYETRTDLSMIFGIPRYLIPQVCKAYLKFVLSSLSGDRRSRFEHGILYWETRGTIYWYLKKKSL